MSAYQPLPTRDSRRWWQKKRFWALALALVGLLLFGGCAAVVAATAGSIPSSSGGKSGQLAPSAGPAAADVAVTSCEPGPYGVFNVGLAITNSTSRSQSYLVTVSVNDADGNRVAEANGAANGVAPGQKAAAQAVGTLATVPAGAACVLADVVRTPTS